MYMFQEHNTAWHSHYRYKYARNIYFMSSFLKISHNPPTTLTIHWKLHIVFNEIKELPDLNSIIFPPLQQNLLAPLPSSSPPFLWEVRLNSTSLFHLLSLLHQSLWHWIIHISLDTWRNAFHFLARQIQSLTCFHNLSLVPTCLPSCKTSWERSLLHQSHFLT